MPVVVELDGVQRFAVSVATFQDFGQSYGNRPFHSGQVRQAVPGKFYKVKVKQVETGWISSPA
jgi:hypothetical protein